MKADLEVTSRRLQRGLIVALLLYVGGVAAFIACICHGSIFGGICALGAFAYFGLSALKNLAI